MRVTKTFINHGCCGVNIIHQFGNEYATADPEKDNLHYSAGGCGWLQAGFIVDDSRSEYVFQTLMNRFELVFISEQRINKNTGNTFFFAIWDMTKEKK